MSYEYTDADGARLNVDEYATNLNLYVTDRGQCIGLLIPHEDAPAVALAILEAAGITPDALSGNREQRAAAYLKAWSVQYAQERAKRAEREAEDAKVCDYFEFVNNGARPAWGIVSEAEKRECRAEYRRAERAAREFFTREHEDGWQDKTAPPIGDLDCVASTDEIITALEDKPAPRVLNHGDPEPGGSTRWRDSGGIRWVRSFDGWITSPADEEGVEWTSIHPDHFPMTEVTP